MHQLVVSLLTLSKAHLGPVFCPCNQLLPQRIAFPIAGDRHEKALDHFYLPSAPFSCLSPTLPLSQPLPYNASG